MTRRDLIKRAAGVLTVLGFRRPARATPLAIPSSFPPRLEQAAALYPQYARYWDGLRAWFREEPGPRRCLASRYWDRMPIGSDDSEFVELLVNEELVRGVWVSKVAGSELEQVYPMMTKFGVPYVPIPGQLYFEWLV